MKVTLINCTPNPVETLIFTKQTRLNMGAARWDEVMALSYEEKMNEIAYMADSIPSSWEFVDFIFAIEGVSRGFTHQFVRTRTNSYAQQSMRVTDMGGFQFTTGPGIQESAGLRLEYSGAMQAISSMYNKLLEMGAPIEDARGILPTNIATNIVAKINLRTLSDMARSRTGGRTQSEYRDVMDEMINCVLDDHHWTGHFLFPKGRKFFDEVEMYARSMPNAEAKGRLMKIIDKMRKAL